MLRATLAAAVTAMTIAAGAAGAHYVPHHRSFATMTPTQKMSWFDRQARHDRGAIRWLEHHLTTATLPSREVLDVRMIPLEARFQRERWWQELRWYRASLGVVSARSAELHALLDVPAMLREHGLGLPPQWWLTDVSCIRMGESTDGAGSSNLYGMLAGWGAAGGGSGLDVDGRPNAWEASPKEQLYRTWILWNMDGWSPWTTARGCGLR